MTRPMKLSTGTFGAAVLAAASLVVPACNRAPSDVREIQHAVSHLNYGRIGGRVVALPEAPAGGPAASPDAGNAGQAEGEQQPASGATVMLLDLKDGRQYLETLEKSPQKSCVERLSAMQSALTQFAQGAQAGKGAPTTQTDRDGYFMFQHLPAGAYLVVAEGHAGTTDAIWAEPSEVIQDKATVVKLASPLVACSAKGAGQ